MRPLSLAACFALSACTTVAAQPAPAERPYLAIPQARSETLSGEAARNLARDLIADIAARVVEAHERNAAGPGAPLLDGVLLYERPRASEWPGVCSVVVHDVSASRAPVFVEAGQAPPPPRRPTAVKVWSGMRYAYEAGGRNPQTRAPGFSTQAACGARSTAIDFFTADGHGTVLPAIEALENVRRYAADPAMRGALSIDCTSGGRPCVDPGAVLAAEARPDQLVHVGRKACGDLPGRGAQCYELRFRDRGEGPGPWVATIRGPERPAHVVLRQDPRPVT